MSTIQRSNEMGDKIHQNQFYFVAKAQLFDSSESNKLAAMSNTAVIIAVAFQIVIQITGMLTKQLRCLLMNIGNMNSETSTIDC